jgi:DHA1 family tetracycline resistance protein-like MFS transporter
LIAGAIGFSFYGLARTGWWFAAGIPIMSMWGLYGPSAQGLMTRRVGPTEQGRLQGALSSVSGMTGILGPGLFSMTFATAIGPLRTLNFPGAPFVLASALLTAGAVIGYRLTRVP